MSPLSPEDLRRIRARYPGITSIHVSRSRSSEVQCDVRFPEHQLIVNAPVSQVAAILARELERLEARDPSVAAPVPAKAA